MCGENGTYTSNSARARESAGGTKSVVIQNGTFSFPLLQAKV